MTQVLEVFERGFKNAGDYYVKGCRKNADNMQDRGSNSTETWRL